MSCDTPKHIPTPADIERETALIRESWTEAEILARSQGIIPSARRSLRKGGAFRWRPPVCKTPRML